MKNAIADLCHQLSLGVYIIGASHKDRHDAFTASSVMLASFQPLLLAVSINPDHASYPLIRSSRTFSVSVLRRDQTNLARHFGAQSGHDLDKLRNVAWRSGTTGAPILDDAMAWFECELSAVMPAGDHRIVLGKVVDGEVADAEGNSLLYSDTGNIDGSARFYREHYF